MYKKCLIIFLLITNLLADENKTLPKIGVYEKLGEYVPLDLVLTDQTGKSATLKEFMNDKPTVISFNYYTCPGICSPQLAGMAKVIDNMELIPRDDYNILTISINRKDTVEAAYTKQQAFLNLIKKKKKLVVEQAWKFMVASQYQITKLTDSMGFKYEKRVKNGITDYLHPGVLIVISPKGKIARYLNGISYLPFDLKLALAEASKEITGPTIAKSLLLCFAYDPINKTYVFQAEKVVGVVMTVMMIIFFIWLARSGRREDVKEDKKQ